MAGCFGEVPVVTVRKASERPRNPMRATSQTFIGPSLVALTSKMLFEPFARELCDAFERAGLFEKMRGTGNDLEAFFTAKLRVRLAVQFDDDAVIATDDEKRGGLDTRQGIAREIRPAAARDDCFDH